MYIYIYAYASLHMPLSKYILKFPYYWKHLSTMPGSGISLSWTCGVAPLLQMDLRCLWLGSGAPKLNGAQSDHVSWLTGKIPLPFGTHCCPWLRIAMIGINLSSPEMGEFTRTLLTCSPRGLCYGLHFAWQKQEETLTYFDYKMFSNKPPALVASRSVSWATQPLP